MHAGILTVPQDTTGLYGTFALRFEANNRAQFTYTLDNNNPAVEALGAGESLTETFTVAGSQITGPTEFRGPISATITMNIQGGPLSVIGGGNTVTTTTSGGAVTDTLAIDNLPATPPPNWRTADLGMYGALTLNPATGAWTYALDNTRPATQALGLADTRVETFTATTTIAGTPLTATITINLNAGVFPDDPPIATAMINGEPGAEGAVDEGEMVTLTGAGTDPEDDPITNTDYQWAQVQVPDDAMPVIFTPANGQAQTVTFMAPEERVELTFTLTVTANGLSSPALEVTIQVGRTSERALQKTLAAFGRAFAADAVDMISGHLAGNGTAAANRFTLGGREIPAQAGIQKAPALALENQSNPRGNIWQNDNPRINYLSTRALLTKSAFHYNLSDSGSTGSGSGALSIWGRATHGNYEGRPDNFTLDGNLSSAYLGLDFRAGERRQAGVAISYTEGDVDYTDALDDSTGNLDAELTSVLPYMRYTTDSGLGVWGLLGYGTGDATLRTDDGDPIATDIEMRLAAAGVRGTWLSPQHQELAWKAGVFAVEMESEAVASQELPSVDAESQRLRLAIAGRARHEVPGSGEAESAYIAPTWELGLRWDDGDAESGAGADLGLGLQYNNPHSGWNVQARGRYLLVHEEGDYEEWSASMEARKNLGSRDGNGRGLALTLTPDWNQRQSSQRVGLDFSGLINSKWKTDGLRLEVYGERHQRKDDDAPGHEVGLSGSLRF